MNNTFKLLEDNIEIAFVSFEDKLISSALFIYNKLFVHYHLGGSLKSYWPLRPNNLLFYQAALRYREMGKKNFHLGGGYKGNDSLVKFKRGFNEKGILDFYVGKKIHNRKVYNQLVKEWEKKNSLEDNFRTAFFPLYRSKL